MRIKKIKVPIYYGWLHIIVTDGDMKHVAEKYELKEDVSNYGAFVWSNYVNGVSQYYICLEEGCKGDLLAHEAVHLVNSVFIHIGAKLDPHNDEHQAYLTAWFFKKVRRFLKKKE